MKRLIIFATVAVLAMSACAQSSEVKKYINKYDVIYYVKDIMKDHPDIFWTAIGTHNKRVEEIGKAIESGNKTALQTADNLIELCATMQYYDVTVDGYTDLTDRIAKDLGIEDEHRKTPIRIINDDSFNASMDPMGQMRINAGAIRALSYEELIAVCAHELAHLACMHGFDRAWKGEKKKKAAERKALKDEILAELKAAGMLKAPAKNGKKGKNAEEPKDGGSTEE